MLKVAGMLVALALFGALPAVSGAQGTSPSGGGGTVSSGNTQDGDIDQGAQAGGDIDGDGRGDHGDSDGGKARNQACLIQQNAGRDANAACNQEQNFNSSTTVNRDGVGGGDVDRFHGDDDDNDVDSVGVGGVGGGVGGVTLARTGFDAWALALLGGLSLADGIGLLAAQRRGRLSA